MPTYEYQCGQCGKNFERRQRMNEEPLAVCPECGGNVKRLVSGGTGFVMKGAAGHGKALGGCSFETTGRTCCGAAQRCGQSDCGE